MQVPIRVIQIKGGRRSLDAGHVKELTDSIRELGLLNPITIDREYFLIAGLHRLEAAKELGWTEVECTVSSLEGLMTEMAEIDENIVRCDIQRWVGNTSSLWRKRQSPMWIKYLRN